MSKEKKKPDSPFSALRELRDKMAKEEADAEAKKREKKTDGAKGAAPSPPRAPAAKTKTSHAASSADDELAFHRLMSGVTPLDDKRGRVPKIDVAREGRRARPAPPADETMEHLRILVEEGSKFEVVDDGRRVEGHRVDVPPDFVRKLRRGGFPIDGSLDLHGRTADESREAVASFLKEKRARGERCVLIVHGKGRHSAGGIPILRGEISAWLSQGAASNHVAAFATAHEDDGGDGAVYVLLRK